MSLKLNIMANINYFDFPELIKTDTGIKNCPKELWVVSHILKTAQFLEEVRIILGAPIIVNSCYRNKAVNAKVGGVKNSYHLYGRAADITCSSFRFKELGEILQRMKDRGKLIELKVYPSYYHIAL